ncbi:MAG: 3-hydroxyacyl-CoA dehydrogenase NAD-binding domain-containing protein [Pseudomonadales bacterium]|nr:3-hydroxyacyl-CoA dehydrogenase NAD-binding domain-containing protein [Pseudomonadales bacterium]
MSVFNYEKDTDGIVTITMDMTGPVNSMNDEFLPALSAAVERLTKESDLMGVIFASAKKTFFAGGNLHSLLAAEPGMEQEFFAGIEAVKREFRALELMPVPVVAAINGAALGGGYEICLACNHRIAYKHKSVQIGLPEVGLGLLPGGGGVVRLTNLLGIEKALPYLLEGKKVTPEKAVAVGMIDETVDKLEDLVPKAKAYILASQGDEASAVQPWDAKDFRIPGGKINSPKNAQMAMMAPAMLRQKTRGLLPAPEVILDTAFQAALVDFDTAQRVESRGLTQLVMTPQAKNMISTFFFGLNKVNGGASRPKNIEKNLTRKVGVLGAGMMGQGIAYVSAMAGIEVVLKDISNEAAEAGKAYSEKLLQKQVSRGRMDEAKAQAVLGLITPTANDEDLQGCDLIIEAVFENIQLKNKITAATEKYLSDDGFWGSNTSTLPITQLAEGSAKPENFIGIHFFSPVDKMPLVEIICGEKTSDEALAKAFDYTMQIRKTPIVVNDSLAFFTSRTFGTYLDEGGRILTEGCHPVKLDNLGQAVGMPVGPLAVQDETSLELSRKAMETWEEMGVLDKWGNGDNNRRIIKDMITDNGRGGRHHGGGYYEYPETGEKYIWPGLYDLYYDESKTFDDEDIKDRLLFRQVIETLKCLETNVLRTVADGNIGSIMGIGAPIWTGGFLQFVNTYGLQKFIDRCGELEAEFGQRFACPQIVKDKLAANELFI